MHEDRLEAHAETIKECSQRIEEYMTQSRARLSEKQKDENESGLTLNLLQLIAIDPAHKEGLPDKLKMALIYIDKTSMDSQLSTRILASGTAFDMALNVGNYKLIQEFLELKLPLTNDKGVNILQLLVAYLSTICRDKISQEDQNDFVALFKDCLERILKDPDTLKTMEVPPKALFTAWNAIVREIFSVVQNTLHQTYYKSMFDQLTDSLIINKSPDLILHYDIAQPETTRKWGKGKKQFKDACAAYLKTYVEGRKKRAEYVKTIQQKKPEKSRENPYDDCCLRLIRLMIDSVWE